MLIDFYLLANSQFWESSVFTVCILDFPSFLLASAFNNAFVVKLVKMWLGGAPHVVVRTLR